MNKLKYFTTTGLLLAVVFVLAVGNTGCTAKARKTYHETRADRFYAAGQFDRAEIEYLNVLRNDSRDAQAIGRLGLIYYQEGRIQTAYPYLLKGSELATNDLALRLKLGFIYAATGRSGDARDAANFVLDRKPQDGDAPLLLAQSAGTPTAIAAARERLERLAGAGDRAAYQVALGTLDFQQHDFKSAAASYQRALSLDPKFSAAWAAQATLCVAENDLTNAETNFKSAADLAPDRSSIRVVYARFKVINGDAAGGRQILEEVVKRTPDYLPAWMELAEIALVERKFDKCQEALDRVLDRDRDNFDGMMLDSRLKLVQKNLPAAIAELERMTQIFPQASRAYYQLAQAYLANGDFDKATANLEQAIARDPDFAEATMLLAKIQIQNRNLDTAISELEKLVRQQPLQVKAQLLLAAAYRQDKRFDDAMTIYNSLEKALPGNPQIPLLIGSVYVDQNDNAGARREFDRAQEMAPDNLQVLAQLVDLDLSEKQYTAALGRVQGRLQKNPGQAELYMLQARVFSAEGEYEQSEAALRKGLAASPDNANLTLLLAQAYVVSKQNDQALVQLDRVLAGNPKNLSALMLKASIYGLNQDFSKQADIYEKMLEIEPNDPLALNNLAYLYSENLHQLDRAYELAQRARVLLPFDPSAADTLGWIYFLRGAYPTALGLLQQSAAALPNEPENQFHLGKVNYMLGNEDAARTAFQRALQITAGPEFPDRDECRTCLAILAINPQSADANDLATLEKRTAEKPDDTVALGRLAAAYQYRGKPDQAIASYEAVLRAVPNNLAAMLNLAQLYAAKNPAKAYELAQSAYKLAPDHPAVARIYGRLAYQDGDFKLANALLQQAVQRQTDDSQTLFDFGRSAYSLGKISDATTALQNALQLNLPAPQSMEAKRLLDMIDLAADPARAATATAQVSEILSSEPNYVPALMVDGIIDERNAHVASAEAAYEKILAQYPDFSPAQRLLAILYSQDPARLSRAYDLAVKARAVYPNDAPLAKATGILLCLQGDYSHASSLLKGTSVMLPDDAELFYYLGSAQFKLNQDQAAKASLRKALNLKLSGKLADSARQMLKD
jgi:tetratricopeptide (TPR) repeat protein